MPATSNRAWLVRVAGRCQVLAGRVSGFPARAALFADLADLAADLDTLSPIERLTFQHLLRHVLARFIEEAGLTGEPRVSERFLKLSTIRLESEEWQRQWIALAHTCAALLTARETIGARRPADNRIRRMLQMIDAQYRNPTFRVGELSNESRLSPGYAGHLLKARTGRKFNDHVHRKRILEAQGLLAEGRLSVKEIAAMVGYSGQGQLARHFRSVTGVTPSWFKQADARRRQQIVTRLRRQAKAQLPASRAAKTRS
jgi:AraC-like DNA-binding protein